MGQGFRRLGTPFCLQGELVTASKAIIEKEYQPHVIVSTTGPNPFNTLTDQELEEYRREVERKQKGPGGECLRAWASRCGARLSGGADERRGWRLVRAGTSLSARFVPACSGSF